VGVNVPSGSNLNTFASNNPANTVFCLAAGTFTANSISPKAGQQWVGALGAAGQRLSIITGNGTVGYMLQCHIPANCVGLQFKNFILERFVPQLQQNPIQGPTDETYVNWIIDNVESRENAAVGLGSPNGTTVRNSYIHHNHQMGVHGRGDNTLWENNEIAFNNYLHESDPEWEAGGSKWVQAQNLTVRGNYVHDNCGPGLWTDGNNNGVVYENNRVVNNASAGIFHEISGQAIIRNNYVEGNALGLDANPACTHQGTIFGIYISSSHSVEIYGNVLVNNEGGIGSQQENRGFANTTVKDLYVHDNDTTLQQGWSGFRWVSGPTDNTNIRFEGNDYDVPTLTGSWWNFNGMKTWGQWQTLGHDDTGTVR
jgi:parallel beta-helix repeat protein